jgi:hypothetical protein
VHRQNQPTAAKVNAGVALGAAPLRDAKTAAANLHGPIVLSIHAVLPASCPWSREGETHGQGKNPGDAALHFFSWAPSISAISYRLVDEILEETEAKHNRHRDVNREQGIFPSQPGAPASIPNVDQQKHPEQQEQRADGLMGQPIAKGVQAQQEAQSSKEHDPSQCNAPHADACGFIHMPLDGAACLPSRSMFSRIMPKNQPPHPVNECMKKDAALRPSGTFLDSGLRSEWLKCRFVA